MTKILVVRHGHAEGNAEHRFIGQTDVPLDELGREQAQSLAGRLTNEPIDRIVSSDLRRAIDTISPLATKLGVPIELDRRLREISNGEWSGLLPTEISARWADLWTAYRSGVDVVRPGGERWGQVRVRAIAAVDDAAVHGGTVLVCTHGGPALCLAQWAAGHPVGGNIFLGRLAAVANASITTIELPPLRLAGFNDVGHLGAGVDLRLPFEPR
ncbi:MAG: histidine phosphatase family protein [Acidimicrobiia bacterium]